MGQVRTIYVRRVHRMADQALVSLSIKAGREVPWSIQKIADAKRERVQPRSQD